MAKKYLMKIIVLFTIIIIYGCIENPEVELEKISITRLPKKTTYYVGESKIDLTDLEITGTYSNNSQKKRNNFRIKCFRFRHKLTWN